MLIIRFYIYYSHWMFVLLNKNISNYKPSLNQSNKRWTLKRIATLFKSQVTCVPKWFASLEWGKYIFHRIQHSRSFYRCSWNEKAILYRIISICFNNTLQFGRISDDDSQVQCVHGDRVYDQKWYSLRNNSQYNY